MKIKSTMAGAKPRPLRDLPEPFGTRLDSKPAGSRGVRKVSGMWVWRHAHPRCLLTPTLTLALSCRISARCLPLSPPLLKKRRRRILPIANRLEIVLIPLPVKDLSQGVGVSRR